MRFRLGDKARLNQILDAISEVEHYTLHSDFETFSGNSMMRFACIKQLEIIGEASDYFSEEIKMLFSDMEWRKINGMRNVFVNEHFEIDSKLIWEMIKYDLPDLKRKVIDIGNAIPISLG